MGENKYDITSILNQNSLYIKAGKGILQELMPIKYQTDKKIIIFTYFLINDVCFIFLDHLLYFGNKKVKREIKFRFTQEISNFSTICKALYLTLNMFNTKILSFMHVCLL